MDFKNMMWIDFKYVFILIDNKSFRFEYYLVFILELNMDRLGSYIFFVFDWLVVFLVEEFLLKSNSSS